jgi:hypothetical protein
MAELANKRGDYDLALAQLAEAEVGFSTIFTAGMKLTFR